MVKDLTAEDIRSLVAWYRRGGDEDGARDFETLLDAFEMFAENPETDTVSDVFTLKK